LKDKIHWIILITFVVLAITFTYTANRKATDVMERQQIKIEQQHSKIEALQEENAYLHDSHAILSQKLMKENAEQESEAVE